MLCKIGKCIKLHENFYNSMTNWCGIGAVNFIRNKFLQAAYSKRKLNEIKGSNTKIQFAPIDFVVYFTYNKRKKETDDKDEFSADG